MICAVESCEREADRIGMYQPMCTYHLNIWKRQGHPLARAWKRRQWDLNGHIMQWRYRAKPPWRYDDDWHYIPKNIRNRWYQKLLENEINDWHTKGDMHSTPPTMADVKLKYADFGKSGQYGRINFSTYFKLWGSNRVRL